MSSVGAELPRQMARAAHKVRWLATGVVTLENYSSAERLLAAIDRAAEAIAAQDVIAYVQCFEELKALGA